MGSELRFGIIGCGMIGRLHARVLGTLDDVQVIGVADVDPRASAWLGEHVGARVMDIDELLASSDVDAVTVCTPSGFHAGLGARAARAGKHVLLEKPIDVTLEAADDLLRACEENGVSLSVIAQHRFDDSLIRLKVAIDEGRLGTLLFGAATVDWFRGQEYYDSSSWRGTRRLDGGALLNQGVHYVDLMLWLFGPARRVFARVATVSHQMECEDLALVSVEFESGALGTIQVTTSAYPGFPERISVTGSEGSVHIEGTDVAVWGIRGESDQGAAADGGPRSEASADPANLADESHRRHAADFVDAVRTGREPAVGGRDARRALELVLAAYESSQRGQPVDLPVEVLLS